MIIHYLQHVKFEGLGSIENWVNNAGHEIASTKLYKNETFPDIKDFHWLIIMGGPMSVHDTSIYPWLGKEKEFIRRAIDSDKTVIGICLGAQLIAEVLGSKIYPARKKEIGWHPIRKSSSKIADVLLDNIDAFHWHGETFDLPNEAIRLASSDVCENQAFIFKERVLGLQFHLESIFTSVKELREL